MPRGTGPPLRQMWVLPASGGPALDISASDSSAGLHAGGL